MKKLFVVDTNVLLNNISALNPNEVVITIMLMQEIDKHKSSNNPDLAYRARVAQRWIQSNKKNLTFDFQPYSNMKKLLKKNKGYDPRYIDNHFLECLLQNKEYGLISEDLNLAQQAEAFGATVKSMKSVKTDIYNYKGYRKLDPNEDADVIARIYEGDESVAADLGVVLNEYVIVDDQKKSFEKTVFRFDGEILNPIALPHRSIMSPLNAEQACVLDALNDDSLTAVFVLGLAGSGKTMMSVKMAQHKIFDKGTYAKAAFIRKADFSNVGFLPGGHDEKMDVFFEPFAQHLNNPQKDMEHMVANGQLTKHEVGFTKGLSMNHTLLLVDECSDLTVKEIKNCGTRVGEKSKVVFTGDYAQTNDSFVKSSGLLDSVDRLKGKEGVAVIVLTEDHRSPTCRVFANSL